MLLDGAGKLPELRLQAGNAGGGGAVQPGVEQWGRKATGQAVTAAVGGSAGLRLCALHWSKGLCESETRGVRK